MDTPFGGSFSVLWLDGARRLRRRTIRAMGGSSSRASRWARARFGVALPAERTAVFGASAGGELALGLRHPDVYGAVLSGSPGAGYKPPGAMPRPIPRTYLVAGTLEPFFLENASRWAVALRDAGADVVMSERVAAHGNALWRAEFPLMVAWAFGRRQRTRSAGLPPSRA